MAEEALVLAPVAAATVPEVAAATAPEEAAATVLEEAAVGAVEVALEEAVAALEAASSPLEVGHPAPRPPVAVPV